MCYCTHNIQGDEVMQGEYKGKPIFRHRYVGMDEEAIREEIERLQDELYSMQEALDFFYSNSNEVRREANEAQLNNSRVLKGIDEKLVRLQMSLDYEAPVKTQLEKVTKDYNEKIFNLNNERWTKLYRLTIFNSFLIVSVAIVVCFLIFFSIGG